MLRLTNRLIQTTSGLAGPRVLARLSHTHHVPIKRVKTPRIDAKYTQIIRDAKKLWEKERQEKEQQALENAKPEPPASQEKVNDPSPRLPAFEPGPVRRKTLKKLMLLQRQEADREGVKDVKVVVTPSLSPRPPYVRIDHESPAVPELPPLTVASTEGAAVDASAQPASVGRELNQSDDGDESWALGELEKWNKFVKTKYPVFQVQRRPPKGDEKFAVVAISGRQWRVLKDDLVMVSKLKDVEVGQTIELKDVLLVGTRNYTLVGLPHVEKAKVTATVEEHTQIKEVIVFKKKRRKGYKRTKIVRDDVTILRVLDIESPEGAPAAPSADKAASAAAGTASASASAQTKTVPSAASTASD